jgi:hypothetical protein
VAKSKKDYKKKLAKFFNIEPQHLEPPAIKKCRVVDVKIEKMRQAKSLCGILLVC